MTTLGDQVGPWVTSGDGLTAVVAGLFVFILVSWAIIAVTRAMWSGIGR